MTTRTAQSPTSIQPAGPTMAVLRAEARLFGRELGSLFYILLFPVVLLSILGAIPSFREDNPDLGGMSVVDLYVPVTVLLSMIMAALMAMPSIVLAYREAGVLRRLRTTPVRPASILVVQVLLHAATVAASSILLLTVGRLVFGTPLPQSWPGYICAYLLALVASFSLGAAITAISPNARVAAVFGSLAFFGSMFTAGVYLPVQAMGGLLRRIVEFTPLGAASEAMNAAMLGALPDVGDLLVVAAWGALLALFSVRLFRWQ
ncbi:ABC transporter permease [Nocardioides sp. AE5]|uniref:ABC transporter permease n=1 Tax=Nocardioides sp. AE5 TaxID=2962573 RepID=UPI0028822514|nr:ABC transporter permease [Nocardioides sp. AE5]MDT0201735.1 ABC transporter permease [Nocardioides sp. AE5]